MTAPLSTRPEVARAYAITRLEWIRRQQKRFKGQAREPARQFVERESHYLWGRRYLLSVQESDAKPSVRIDHRRINLTVRAGSARTKRRQVIHEWHKELLHGFLHALIKRWEPKLGVHVRAYYLQRMKTKWGSCNHRDGNIRLNTELVKKPKDLVEYIVVHEMIHLLEPTHSERFIRLLTLHFPNWREARAELNELPLGSETWRE
jgi:predicted metal-dependent hydrolase